MIFYEPIRTTAPADARPYCCYLNRVIFYKHPRTLAPDGFHYEQWDEVESAWNLLGERYTEEDLGWSSLAPFVLHRGIVYELGGGSVIWRNSQWFHQWTSWRVDPSDSRDAWRLSEAWKMHKRAWRLHYSYSTCHQFRGRWVVGYLLR